MLHKTKGIVLKTIKYGESSVISKIYTEQFGLQTYIINSVRSSKSKNKASLLQPLTLLDMVVYHRENKNMHRISEMKNAFIFTSILFDNIKRTITLFLEEILLKSIREEEPNKDQFGYLWFSIQHLDQTTHSVANFPLHFMLQFSRHLGFYPNGDYSRSTPYFDMQEGCFTVALPDHIYVVKSPLAEKITELIRCRPDEIHSISFVPGQRKELVNLMVDYYRLHLEQFYDIRSPKILEDILGV